MIYGVAAGLGAEKTRLWLLTALGSLALKIVAVDPCKQAVMAGVTQHADHLEMPSDGGVATAVAAAAAVVVGIVVVVVVADAIGSFVDGWC